MKDHLEALIRRHDPLRARNVDDIDLVTRGNALRLLARSGPAR